MPRRRPLRRPRQLGLPRTAGWGGRRAGAGRKRGDRVSHSRRSHAKRFPLHVTLRVLPHVWNLCADRCLDVIADALEAGCDRFGMRIIDFDVEGNHLHFIVEADDQRALSRGMQGFKIRLARGLNRVMRRGGTVFADRYHSRPLRTPREVRNALNYVSDNHSIHAARAGRRRESITWRGRTLLSRHRHRRLRVAPRTWLLCNAFFFDDPPRSATARRRR